LSGQVLVYVGTYTGRGSEGIYVYQLDLCSGALEPIDKASSENPSFLSLDPTCRYLYAVNELKEYEGKPTGTTSAFSVNQETGQLKFLNRQLTQGPDPAYVSVDKTGRYAFVANYANGSITVFRIEKNGELGNTVDHIQHQGSSVHPKRQTGPHAHAAVIDEANTHLYVPDLGIDKVMIYRFNSETGKLESNKPSWCKISAGSGPRHFVFHPKGKFAYLINELNSTITALNYDKKTGGLSEIETVYTLSDKLHGENTGSDLHVTVSGEYLYGSNRGHDSIVAYRINQKTGKLDYLSHTPTRGKTPRGFAIDPTDGYLLVANMDTSIINVFAIEKRTGELSFTGHTAQVSMPACIKIGVF